VRKQEKNQSGSRERSSEEARKEAVRKQGKDMGEKRRNTRAGKENG
jgi:hypothetical protein